MRCGVSSMYKCVITASQPWWSVEERVLLYSELNKETCTPISIAMRKEGEIQARTVQELIEADAAVLGRV